MQKEGLVVKSLRLNKTEELTLKEKSQMINKMLVDKNQKVMTESEILHRIIMEGMRGIQDSIEKAVKELKKD